MLECLEDSIKQVIKEKNFSGSVMVKQDEEEFKVSAGFSNREENLFNHIDTRFGIASGCKLFTAIGIAQLVEKKRLSFDTKLTDCLWDTILVLVFIPHIILRRESRLRFLQTVVAVHSM